MGALKKRVPYCHARESFLNPIAFQTQSQLQQKLGKMPVIKALSGVWEHEMEGWKSRSSRHQKEWKS